MNLNWKDKIRKFLFNSKCSVCEKEVEEDEIYICKNCRKKILEKKELFKLENVYFLFRYENEIKKLITDYKLNERRELSKFFKKLIEKELKKIIKEDKIEVIIPVPASKEKIKRRGFNQVELILDEIGLSYVKISRKKDTVPMHKIYDKKFRKMNIKSAFCSDISFKNKNILIVDDIITTGSTIKEIIKTLKKLGEPKNIFIFSISVSKNFSSLKE